MKTVGSGSLHRDRGEYLIWCILIGGALVLRGAFVTCRIVLTGDEVHYAESLHRFLEGRFLEGISSYWSFLYPLLALPFGRIYGNAEPALRLLSIISGAVLLIPCMLLARRLWGGRAALFAGIFIAIHPNLVFFSTGAMTESLYSLLLVCSLLLLVKYVQEGGRWIPALMGAVLSLAYQTRQEAQFVLLFVVIVMLLGRGGGGIRGPFKSRAGRAAIVVAVFVLVALPYVFLLHGKTGRWSAGSKASINLSSPHIWNAGLDRERYVYSLTDDGTRRRIEEAGRENAARVFWRQKGAIASEYFPKLSRGIALVPVLFSTPFLLLLVPLGIFGRDWKRGERGPELILFLMGAFPFLFFSLFRIEFRYLVPFLPLYLLWGARGCEVLAEWLKVNVSRRQILAAAILFLVFISLVPFTIRKYSLNARNQPIEYKEIGYWIRDNYGSGVRVLAESGSSISYYAGNPAGTFIPWTGPEGLLRYARQHHFELLVVDEDYFRSARPPLAPILGEASLPGLEKAKTFTGRRGNKISLYMVKPIH